MAQSFDTSLKTVAINYMRLMGARVTQSSIGRDLESNPYYPTLLSLSETFNKYKIRNSAFSVGKEDFDQLQAPFVAFVSIPGIGNDFVLVTDIGDNTIRYKYKTSRPVTMAKDTFLEHYQNMIWVADSDETSGEQDFEKKYSNERRQKLKHRIWFAALLTLTIMVVASSYPKAMILSFATIAFLILMGLTVTVMLLIYEIDNSNAFVNKLCNTGSRTSCDAVINSKAAKIAGVSWSEIGFFYFSGSLLILIMPAFSFIDKIACIAIANIAALPYILFSLYYQWRVVRQWCPLCLSIQLALFAEFIWCYKTFWVNLAVSPPNLGSIPATGVIVSICTPILFWTGIKAVISRAKTADANLAAFQRLQHNPEIFSGLLLQQRKASDAWMQLGIDLGNPRAKHTIIKVCNPYCGPCASIHPRLERIIRENSNVKLKVIFTSRNKDGDLGAIVAKHLLEIASGGDMERTSRALEDWYGSTHKDYDAFSKHYPFSGDLSVQDDKLEAMSKWCSESEIMYTPTIFVNGYLLPENYNVDELKSIL